MMVTGKTDVAVYRPSSTYRYRLDSSTGAFVPVLIRTARRQTSSSRL